MNSESFRNMYDDFFGTSKELSEEEEKRIEESDINIDDLLIDNASKDLLKKIITFMDDYNNSRISNYITFNIILNVNNKETKDSILKILQTSSKNYIINNKISSISLYDVTSSTNVSDYFNNGIVSFSDLSAFEIKDVKEKSLFMHSLKNNLSGKNINLLIDEKKFVDSFLTYDNDLKNNYFNFVINGINPEVQDVYNEIISKVNIDESLNVKLLDYISETYLKSNTDYVTYRNMLIQYLAFNKDVPSISEQKSNEEIFQELNELVGLDEVKIALKDLVNLILLKKKTDGDLKIKDINLHMVFLGNPGTGKTTVARLLSGILYNLGYIKENKLIEVSSKDLVAEYVGQTAPKTNAVVERAKGGILFIDEAYALASDGNSSYNDEAIATLIKAMEDYRDNLVVIFAGYTKEMQAFLDSNSGIVSRVGYTLNFKDYTVDELLEIFKSMIFKAGFKVTDNALNKALGIIKDNIGIKNFGNARFVRNMYEKTVVRHATNTKDKKRKDILITITEDDINIDNLITE